MDGLGAEQWWSQKPQANGLEAEQEASNDDSTAGVESRTPSGAEELVGSETAAAWTL